MAEADMDALVGNFMAVTGVTDKQQAAFYVEASKGNLDDAVNTFLESGADGPMAGGPPAATPDAHGHGHGQEGNGHGHQHGENCDHGDEGSGAGAHGHGHGHEEPSRVAAPVPFGGAGAFDAAPVSYRFENREKPPGDLHRSAGHMRTKDMMKLGEGYDTAAEKEGIGDGKEFATELLKKAMDLAENPDQREELLGQMAPSEDGPAQKRVLTFWQNGFTIGDGELLPYEDPRNSMILRQIQLGRIPAALKDPAHPNADLEIVQMDKRNEQYVKRFKAFGGGGNALGSAKDPTPVAASSSSSSSSSAAAAAAASDDLSFDAFPAEESLPAAATVDDSQATTSIQVRLSTGARLVAQFNHTHTVKDLVAFVKRAQASPQAFELRTAFPPKPLNDMDISLADAGLLNAAVMQHLV